MKAALELRHRPTPRGPCCEGRNAQRLRKAFGGLAALDDVSLTVRRGEFLALLGPSGSGKTTLLRVLAGLDFADPGSIAIGGRRWTACRRGERRIGFVFQHYALFRHMTVARNIAFGLDVRPRRTPPARGEIRARVAGLAGHDGHSAIWPTAIRTQISGGQRQRVALARALAIEPDCCCWTSRSARWTPKCATICASGCGTLHDRMGLTSIFVTHDQDEAMEMADRVAVMRAGRIEQVDVPDRLYAEPANAFVHEFLGELSGCRCTVEAGRAHFDSLPLPPLPTACEPGPAVALIRPHEIRLTGESGLAVVETVHASGPLAHIRLRVGQLDIEVTQPFGSALPRSGSVAGSISASLASTRPTEARPPASPPSVHSADAASTLSPGPS